MLACRLSLKILYEFCSTEMVQRGQSKIRAKDALPHTPKFFRIRVQMSRV